ncbi:PTS system fructose-specific EIIABC component [bacterium HR11]|nr:PTS system fructose-specific EIIABC component [bacterium HR11]
MSLSEWLTPGAVRFGLHADDVSTALAAIADHLIAVEPRLALHRRELLQRLLDRERMESTALDNQTALPHCKMAGLPAPVVCIDRSEDGVPFRPGSDERTHLFFTIVSPEDQPATHLKVLAAVARFLRDAQNVRAVLAATSPSEVLEYIQRWDRSA